MWERAGLLFLPTPVGVTVSSGRVRFCALAGGCPSVVLVVLGCFLRPLGFELRLRLIAVSAAPAGTGVDSGSAAGQSTTTLRGPALASAFRLLCLEDVFLRETVVQCVKLSGD